MTRLHSIIAAPPTAAPSDRRTVGPSDRPTVGPSHRWTVPPRLALPLCVPIFLAALGTTRAQEALRYSLTGEAAAVQRGRQKEGQPYSLEAGDLKLLIRPSLDIAYNSNINLYENDAKSDGILRPMLQLNADYPITELNTLNVNVGVGYEFYFQHDEYSSLVLTPGSQLSFDIYIKDLWINIHDTFYYQQDPAIDPSVSGSERYGGFYNTAGLSGVWDLDDIVLSLGYDHYTFISSTSQYDYLDRGTELPVGRAGFRFSSAVTAGLEATGSFNRYDQSLLNNSTGFSVGGYADWQVGEYLKVTPHAGYAAYYFDQTSLSLQAQDQDAWYFGLGVAHRLNEKVSYTLNAGHELRLGIYSDLVDAWYVRPYVNLRVIKDVTLTLGAPYEHGQYKGGGQNDKYDWFGGSVGLGYQLMEKLTTSLTYRFTIRDSSADDSSYTQNLVELRFSYQF